MIGGPLSRGLWKQEWHYTELVRGADTYSGQGGGGFSFSLYRLDPGARSCLRSVKRGARGIARFHRASLGLPVENVFTSESLEFSSVVGFAELNAERSSFLCFFFFSFLFFFVSSQRDELIRC